MDFIEDFRDFILDHVPTNFDWAESIATNVLGTVLGRNVCIKTKPGGLYPNLFFLNIGPSGLAYKSVPLKNFALPTLRKYENLTDTKIILPSRFSVEGLIEYLTTIQNSGIIIRDEFSSMFKDTKKQYLADILEFLSELYDCTLQKRFTRKTKLEETADVCVSLQGATTPYIFNLMTSDFFVQGTGNRILYILSKPGKIQDTDEWFFLTGEKSWEKEQQLDEFAQRLCNLNTKIQKLGVVQPTFYKPEKLVAFINEMQQRTKDSYENDPKSFEHIYLARMAEMAIKLASIKAIGHIEDTSNEIEKTVHSYGSPVHTNDIEWAINKVRRHIKYFYEIRDLWSTFVKSKPALTDKSLINFILTIIKTRGEVMHSDLLKLSGLKVGQLFLIIQTLIARKQVEAFVKQDYKSKGGPKPKFYRLRKEDVSSKQKNDKNQNLWSYSCSYNKII